MRFYLLLIIIPARGVLTGAFMPSPTLVEEIIIECLDFFRAFGKNTLKFIYFFKNKRIQIFD